MTVSKPSYRPPPPDPALMSHVTRNRASHHITPGCDDSWLKRFWRRLRGR